MIVTPVRNPSTALNLRRSWERATRSSGPGTNGAQQTLGEPTDRPPNRFARPPVTVATLPSLLFRSYSRQRVVNPAAIPTKNHVLANAATQEPRSGERSYKEPRSGERSYKDPRSGERSYEDGERGYNGGSPTYRQVSPPMRSPRPVARLGFPGLPLIGLVFIAVISANCATADQPPAASELDFASQIRPILTEKCIGCHSGEKPAGGLDLSNEQRALAAGDSGQNAIVPGQPDASELVHRVHSTDESSQMPPPDHKPLTAAEKASLVTWIQQGAKFNLHWSFRPVSNNPPPAITAELLQAISGSADPTATSQATSQPLDLFIAAKLAPKSIAMSPTADRYTLIRRLYADLLGLLPEQDAIDRFTSDPSPLAYQRLISRVLADPAFGERWGRHWLDMAHYADSDGYEKDRARPDAFRWRDWVIDRLNEDQSFDAFTQEQIAGDLIPHATAQQRLGTAFLRQTLTNEEGGVDQEEYRVNACFDRTETVGTVWMGLTIGCVRCHTHKYDPLPHADYYKLFAYFNNADEVSNALPIEATDLNALEAELAPLQAALAARYRELAPDAHAWETKEHQAIMQQTDGKLAESKLEVVSAESAHPDQLDLQVKDQQITAVPLPVDTKQENPASNAEAKPQYPDEDVYTIVLETTDAVRMTGIKLRALTDEQFPKKGPGSAIRATLF